MFDLSEVQSPFLLCKIQHKQNPTQAKQQLPFCYVEIRCRRVRTFRVSSFLSHLWCHLPGSQEERWQLQIVAKGRVTCPKCKSVCRKTVEGLKKHMENCRMVSTSSNPSFKAHAGWTVARVWRLSSVFGQQPFTCQHCGKQLKSSTGMKYHIMADHSQLVRALGYTHFFPVWQANAVCTIPRRHSAFLHCSRLWTTAKIWTTESSRTNCAKFWRGWEN